MAQTVQPYSKVKYRDANGRTRSATVLVVTDSTTLNLRVGRANGGTTVVGATKQNKKGTTAGWFQGGR